MKKVLSIFALSILFVTALTAASISSPAATVNLYENEIITKQQLAEQVDFFKANGYQNATDAEVLEAMINDMVFLQGAKRDGYYVDDRTLDSLYASQKTGLEEQTGVSITNEQFSN